MAIAKSLSILIPILLSFISSTTAVHVRGHPGFHARIFFPPGSCAGYPCRRVTRWTIPPYHAIHWPSYTLGLFPPYIYNPMQTMSPYYNQFQSNPLLGTLQSNQFFNQHQANQLFQQQQSNQAFNQHEANQLFSQLQSNQAFNQHEANQMFMNAQMGNYPVYPAVMGPYYGYSRAGTLVVAKFMQ